MGEREELLAAIAKHVHPNGRKKRNDAGKERGEYTPRGSTVIRTPWYTYQRMKATVIKHHNGLDFDKNGFHLLIESKIHYKEGYGEQREYKPGYVTNVNVKKTGQQKEINLERYRFNAYYYMACTKPNEIIPFGKSPGKDGVTAEVWTMCIERYNTNRESVNNWLKDEPWTWLDLFQRLYYVGDDWMRFNSFEMWWQHYIIVASYRLDHKHQFNSYHKPGTPEFMPEMAYRVDKIEKQKIIDEYAKKGERSWRRCKDPNTYFTKQEAILQERDAVLKEKGYE